MEVGATPAATPGTPGTPTPSTEYVTPGLISTAASSPGAGPGPATEASRRRSASRSPTPIDSETDAQSMVSASDDNLFDDEDDYERQRQKRMMENQSILASLQLDGGASSLLPFERSPSPAAMARPRPRARPKQYTERRDRAGYIVSLPAPGQRHVLAAVEIDTNRATRRAIDAGEYADCTHWAAGERYRWRFGDGQGNLEPGEAPVVGDVGPDFRWKEFDWGEMDSSPAFSPDPSPAEPVEFQPRQPKKHYSEFTGGTCHQCKRRSDKPKMQCRNVDPECTALFCISCCKRYDYFEFDEESRSFICPLCMGICNCSRCLRLRNLGHLAGGKFGRTFGKFAGAETVSDFVEGETVQHYLERVGKKEPDFDRVRLVDMADDVVSPPLPQEWQDWLEKKRRESMGILARKLHRGAVGLNGKGNGGGKPKDADGSPIKRKRKQGPKGKGKKRLDDDGEEGSDVPLAKKRRRSTANGDAGSIVPRITLRVTVPPPPRQKQVDSDGDTVDDTSSDEDESVAASEASADHATPGNMNDYLARMAAAVVPTLPHLELPAHFEDAEPLHSPLDMEMEMGLDGIPELGGKEYDEFGSVEEQFERMERTLSGDFGLDNGLLPHLDGFARHHHPDHAPLFGPAPPRYSPTLPALPVDATLSPPLVASASIHELHSSSPPTQAPSVSPRTPSRLRSSPHPITPGLGLSSLRNRFTMPDLSPGHDPLPAVYPPYPDLNFRLPAYPLLRDERHGAGQDANAGARGGSPTSPLANGHAGISATSRPAGVNGNGDVAHGMVVETVVESTTVESAVVLSRAAGEASLSAGGESVPDAPAGVDDTPLNGDSAHDAMNGDRGDSDASADTSAKGAETDATPHDLHDVGLVPVHYPPKGPHRVEHENNPPVDQRA